MNPNENSSHSFTEGSDMFPSEDSGTLKFSKPTPNFPKGGEEIKDGEFVSPVKEETKHTLVDKLTELLSLTKDVECFEFEGVIFKGYRPDSIKRYLELNPSKSFYVWLHDTHVILLPGGNVKK